MKNILLIIALISIPFNFATAKNRNATANDQNTISMDKYKILKADLDRLKLRINPGKSCQLFLPLDHINLGNNIYRIDKHRFSLPVNNVEIWDPMRSDIDNVLVHTWISDPQWITHTYRIERRQSQDSDNQKPYEFVNLASSPYRLPSEQDVISNQNEFLFQGEHNPFNEIHQGIVSITLSDGGFHTIDPNASGYFVKSWTAAIVSSHNDENRIFDKPKYSNSVLETTCLKDVQHYTNCLCITDDESR